MAGLAPHHLELLACPEDGASPLSLSGDSLGCRLECRACRRAFPVSGGIPRLLPDAFLGALAGDAADPALALQASEAHARDDESGRYDAIYSDAEYRHELDTYVRMLDPHAGDAVLEVGAGTGRVTKEYARRVRLTAAADFSRSSLARLTARPELAHADLLAVEAEATHLPFASGSFDRSAALSVICFIPEPARRDRLLAELHRVTRPGGTVVVTTYHYAWVKRLWAFLGRCDGALKEGRHSGGRIWYRNDTREELVRGLAAHFRVEEVVGVCHRVPVLSNLSPAISRTIDGALGKLTAISPVFATELAARCTRR